MGFLADAAGILQGGKNSGTNFGAEFQGKLTQWKQGVGSPSDKLYSGGDTEFFKKLRILESTVGPIPFGVDKTAQSGTLSKLNTRTSGTMAETISGVPMWVKGLAIFAVMFGAYKFFTRKKSRR